MTTTTASAVYEIDIAAPPDRVWRAITEPDLTAKYFYGGSFHADALQPGARYRFVNHTEDERVDISGEVVAVDPGRRLVLTQNFLWEPALAAEPATQVTWELTPTAAGTRLRVIQDLRDKAPKSAEANDGGMPHILGGLKSTAEAL